MAERLNVRAGELVLLGVAGIATSYAIAHFIPPGSRWLAYLFCLYGAYGLFFALRGVHRAQRFLGATTDEVTPPRVYALANLRREILRGIGHLNVFLIGVLAVAPPSWFGTFFTAVMFLLVYTMNVNATLDDTLGERLRKADAAMTARKVKTVRKARPRKR